MGLDVCKFFLGVLNEGWSLDAINVTTIFLLPKVSQPSSMVYFWPINLCTIIYKVIANMSNRFRVVLDKCIDTSL